MLKRSVFWKLFVPISIFVCLPVFIASFGFFSSFSPLTIWAGTTLVSLLGCYLTIQKYSHRIKNLLNLSSKSSHKKTTDNDEIQDITQNIKELDLAYQDTYQELTVQKNHFEIILQNMKEGVLSVSSNQKIIFYNPAVIELLDEPDIAQSDLRLWEHPGIKPIQDMFQSASHEQKEIRKELEIIKTERTLQVTATPIPKTGNVILIMKDLTPFKKIEKQRKDFVANVSHELRTPLTSIKGFSQLLLEGAIHDQENNIKFLTKITDQIDQLEDMITSLLSLSKIQSDTHLLSQEMVNWNHVVTHQVDHLKSLVNKKQIQLAIDLSQNEVWVMSDPLAMKQIFNNLFENAIKYTPDKGKISIKTYKKDSWGVLEIKDNGIGIPKHEQDRIFERFYRIDKARSKDIPGTGLGLSIVKNFVNRLGGKIQVSSQPAERGSTFTVFLPMNMR